MEKNKSLAEEQYSQPDFSKIDIKMQKVLLRNYPDMAEVSELAVFDRVLSNMLSHLVSEINKNARRDCSMPNFQISSEEMYSFLGFLLLSGYNLRTSEKESIEVI